MKPCKHPISHALTSFNDVSTGFGDIATTKPGAKIRLLPKALEKKREGEVRSSLDIVIDRCRDFFFREQLPAGYWWAELESNVTITAE
jgi:squalene-hopene/tetraprenyl-beta-curcumene cyclase